MTMGKNAKTAPPETKRSNFWASTTWAVLSGMIGGVMVCILLTMKIPLRQIDVSGDLAIIDRQILNQAETIRTLRDEVDRLERRLSLRGSLRTEPAPTSSATAGVADPSAPLPDFLTEGAAEFEDYARLTLLEGRRKTNGEVRAIPQSRLVNYFGMPAPSLDNQNCATEISPKLRSLIKTRNVGPFKATMLAPALDDVAAVMEKIQKDYPDLYKQLRSYGGFCARLIRGSTERVSRHAFGLALDISIGGTLDQMGDGKTQFGLLVLSDHFNEMGWVWGAAFRREDSMHFEVSLERFETWLREGRL